MTDLFNLSDPMGAPTENMPGMDDIMSRHWMTEDAVSGLAHTAEDWNLPDAMVLNAVHQACTFFGMPEAQVFNDIMTGVKPGDVTTLQDDVFVFNRAQLQSLGIHGEDALTMVYTHECAHRALQHLKLDAWTEELACDFFAGLNAGLNNLDVTSFEVALGSTGGSDTHPHGALRYDFIELGHRVAEEMKASGEEVTFEACIERINEHLQAKAETIDEFRATVDPNYSSTDDTKGLWVDNREYHIKEAERAKEWAEWHRKRASEDLKNGDVSSARSHESTAKSYDQKYKDELDSASRCTK